MPLTPRSQDPVMSRFPLVVALGVMGVAAACAGVLWVLLYAGLLAAANQDSLLWVHHVADPALAPLAIAITRSGALIAVAGYALAFASARAAQGCTADALAMGVTFLGAATTVAGLKPLVHEERPHLFPWIFPDTGFSFPSGHTTLSFAFAGFLVGWLLRKKPRSPWATVAIVLAGLWAVLVGASRTVLGVHWPVDVLASACIGIAWASAGHACRLQLYPPPATTRSQS